MTSFASCERHRANGTVHWQDRDTYALEDQNTLVAIRTAESKVGSMTTTIRSVYKRH